MMMMMMMIVHSSHGDILINEAGEPVEYRLKTDDESHLRSITHFDLSEFVDHYGNCDDEFDILDLGYWYDEGNGLEYEPADEYFRNQQE